MGGEGEGHESKLIHCESFSKLIRLPGVARSHFIKCALCLIN